MQFPDVNYTDILHLDKSSRTGPIAGEEASRVMPCDKTNGGCARVAAPAEQAFVNSTTKKLEPFVYRV